MFTSLRMNLVQTINTSITNSGSYKRLNDIGITMDDNFNLSISDSSKFTKALSDDRQSVTSLVDALMTKLESKVTRYEGTSGYVNILNKSIAKQITSTTEAITAMNEKLSKKEDSLKTQYASVQATLEMMSYEQSMMTTIYNALYSSSS